MAEVAPTAAGRPDAAPHPPWLGDAGWALASGLVLVAGFLGYVYLASVIAASRVEAESVRSVQTALSIYARIVLAKGLLPQVALTFALFLPLDRVAALRQRGVLPWTLALALCALVSGALLAGLLMPASLSKLPAVRFTGAWNYVATVLQMTAAVLASALAVAWLRARAQRGRARD